MTKNYTKEEILGEIRSMFEALFEIDPSTVNFDSKLVEDLDLDSIDAVDMIVQLQKKTGVRIQPEEFQSVKTVGDVVDVLANKLASQP